MIHNFILILCHVGFTILQVVWAVQPNCVPILRIKPYKVTKYKIKKNGWHLVGNDIYFIILFYVIILSLLKNKNKDTHYKWT